MDLHAYWTREMVLDLPSDGLRYETIRSELCITQPPSATHELVLARFEEALRALLAAANRGVVCRAGAISWGPDVLLRPDLCVLRRGWPLPGRWIEAIPHLIVEVVSPESARADHFPKRVECQMTGVREYWSVSPEHHLVEVWVPDEPFPVIHRERIAWRAPGAADPSELDLIELLHPA